MPGGRVGESSGVKFLVPLTALVFVLAVPQQARAQISALKKAVEGKEAQAPAPPEKPEDIRKRLELWNQEARDMLSRLEAAGSAVALPAGITPAELEDRRRDLEQMALLTTGLIKNLGIAADARKTGETSRTEEAGWTGFKESPPYSILMIDGLLNERDAIKAKISSFESSLANFESILTTTLAETKAAEDAVSAAIIAVQNSAPDMLEAAKWRLEAARSKLRLLATRGSYLQLNCESSRERAAASRSDLALVERKIKTAAPNSQFSEEDLAKLGKIADERRQAINKEINAVSKRLKSALATRTQVQAALDALLATATQGKEPEGLALAKFRVEVADDRIESLQSVTEGLESLVQIESLNLKSYEGRRIVMTTSDAVERRKAIESIALFSDRLRAWLNVVENEMATCGAELSKVESSAASISAEDPRFPLFNEQRASRSEKLASLQRVSQAVVNERKLVKRWVADFSPKTGETKLSERFSTLGAGAWSNLKKAWSFEIMSYEEKIEVDGQTITGKLPVTLGMLLRALLFFVIGYWIASQISHRIQRTVVSRGHIAEAQARTLRNWAMIVVGVFLAIGTLSFLRIPLTVFAFFGGALAIGVGFGMQTLIKNFISGIIVLVERKVRVGDILDVDGIIGTVTEVNTRSSVVRSADDVETMIPNSMFLENRVTNWTLTSAKMRRNLHVGVAYGTEPKEVVEILTESAGRHGLICREPAPFAIFEDFGESALMFRLYFWVDMHGSANAMVVASDLRMMIEKRFTEVGIGVPFPQRDMHLATDKPIQVEISNPPASKPDPYA
jgi:potassium-dependent mechanosensitive channel